MRNYSEIARQYAEDVVSGKVDACIYVKAACQRHLDDLKGSEKYYWSEECCDDICDFAEHLVHTKGKWMGTLIVLEPWQVFCLGVPFGWLRKEDGLRRFREMYLEIPRKNGKSVLGAIIGLYMLTRDGELGSEVYSGASSKKQAWEVFGPARLMASRAPGLKDAFGISVNAESLVVLETASKFEPIIGKPGDGASPHCALIDEYHEHKTPELYDTMKTGLGARTQPMIVIITTAGVNLSGPCYAKRNQVAKMLEGSIENDEIFAVIYTLDKDDDWTDFKVWRKANPNMGVSVFEGYLKSQLKDASQIASKQNIIRCKHLNQWMNANTAWMNMVFWNSCGDEGISIQDFEDEPCYIGIDLASKLDIAAVALLFERNGTYFAFGRYYLPQDTIEKPENSHYQSWLAEGALIETPGAITDYGYIESDLEVIKSHFEVKEVAYDPFQATQFSTRLSEQGFEMIEVGQTVKNFSEPMKNLEALVIDGKLTHENNPVMNWMISNVVAHYDQKENIFPNKERKENKIDGVVALIMALARATLGVQESEIDQGFVEI